MFLYTPWSVSEWLTAESPILSDQTIPSGAGRVFGFNRIGGVVSLAMLATKHTPYFEPILG